MCKGKWKKMLAGIMAAVTMLSMAPPVDSMAGEIAVPSESVAEASAGNTEAPPGEAGTEADTGNTEASPGGGRHRDGSTVRRSRNRSTVCWCRCGKSRSTVQ